MISYYKIQTAGKSRVDHRWSKKLVALPVHRLYFIHDGEAIIKTRDDSIRLKPNNLYLLPSFSVIQSNCKSFLDHSYVNFTIIDSDNIFKNIDALSILINDEDSLLEVNRLFKNIWGNYTDNNQKSEMLVRGSMDILLSNFITKSNNKYPEPLKKVVNYMENNLEKSMTIDELSSIACYVPEYFSTLFKEHFSIPPIKYLNRLRIEKSQELLSKTNLSIKEICDLVGISDPGYFNKMFKRELQITPGLFRKKIISELEELHRQTSL